MKKTGCTYAFIMMLSFTALVAPRASAGEPSPYSGTYTLEEVVVSAGGDSIEPAGTVRRITAEDIEMQGARSLDEAIDLVPGLNIRTGGKGVPRVNLRGFRSRHVLLLLDGVPINSTYDGMFDPSMIPVENVRDIKITTGGSSVLYGPGALGGVINILTKRGGPGISGSIDHQFGEHVDYYGRYSLSGAEKNVDFFLSSSLYRTEGYDLSHDFDETGEENGGLRENSHHT
jgi:outer membrane cobalamin receptor